MTRLAELMKCLYCHKEQWFIPTCENHRAFGHTWQHVRYGEYSFVYEESH